MKFLLFAARRLIWAGLLLFAVATLAWILTTALPGDVVSATLGPNASAADLERAEQLFGTNETTWVRYGRYLERLVHLGSGAGDHRDCEAWGSLHVDLGRSFTYRTPVATLIRKRAPSSAWLAVSGVAVQIAVGLPLGILAGRSRGSRLDGWVNLSFALMCAAPTFLIALMLQYFFAHQWGWFPVDAVGLKAGARTAAGVLPALTLGIYGASAFGRIVRGEVGDRMVDPMVVQARAIGETEVQVVLRYALRAASLPILQGALLELGALMGGAMVTERIFRWPGLGELAVTAVQTRDVNVVAGVTFVATFAVVVTTWLGELLVFALDPRTRSPSIGPTEAGRP